ncbi:hypothetical protein BJX63DRAFT_16714 [Aspergillus granulosus]|uniref:Protein kinase domain-containing protein n=1 Tax=Aspergillus granulosus TaxID=176169 RepID=A0ABR4H039_9EURO
MSWTDTFFFQWPPPEWIDSVHEEGQEFKSFVHPKKSWVLDKSANHQPHRPGHIQVFWLAVNYRGTYFRKYVAKVFPDYTEAQAEAQRRRRYTGLPTQKLQNELDPFMNETRVLDRIDRSCPTSQRIYFPKFYGVIVDLDRSQFSHGYFNRRAVVLEAIRPKLSSRRLLAASQEKRTEFRNRLDNLGYLSEFEEGYYISLLIDRTKRLLALHNLGITHGDIKEEHFRLPGDYYDTVLYDFSRSYTYSPDPPYLVNLRQPRSLMEISRAEQQFVEELVFDRARGLDFRDYLVKSTGASEPEIMAALSQPLEEEQLELMIIRVKTRPDDFSMPSVNSIFPFLESIRPSDDLTWHIRRSRQLPIYAPFWVFSTTNGGDQGEIVFVTDRHSSHGDGGEEKGSYLLCMVPQEWKEECVGGQLLKVCLSLQHGVSGCIKTRADINNYA